ncbi:MAG: hypothetical protein ACJ8GN_30190 [Longimicrobiaceae bacterium]
MPAQLFHHPVQTFRGTGAMRRFGAAPDHCPACGAHIEARPLVAHSTSPDDLVVDFAFQCPRVNCRRMFVAEYGLEAGNTFALLAVAAPVFGEAPAYC